MSCENCDCEDDNQQGLFENYPLIINVCRFDDEAKVPVPATANAAGLDLCSMETADLQPGQRRLFKTGIGMALPEGFYAQVCPRSGMALKHGVTVLNAPGIIDSDYRGDIGVILINHGSEVFHVEQGDRIAQLIIQSHMNDFIQFNLVTSLEVTARGVGGFGHTGKN